MKKIYTFVIIAALLFSSPLVLAQSDHSTTSSNRSAFCFALTRGLKIGVRGQEVLLLQRYLNSDNDTRIAAFGAGSPGNETEYFGPATARAVSKFQEKYRDEILTPIGLRYGTGTFSHGSWKKLVKLLRCDDGGNQPPVVANRITAISPSLGAVGTQVSITVSKLSTLKGITFGNGVIYPSNISVSRAIESGSAILTFNVPEYITPTPASCLNATPACMVPQIAQIVTPGNYSVSVVTSDGTSNAVTFTVTNGTTNNDYKVLSPSANENWVKGTTRTIRWQSPNVTYIQAPRFNIYLAPIEYCTTNSFGICTTAVKPYTIAQNVIGSAGLSTYDWNVGSTIENANVSNGLYQVRVCTQGDGQCFNSETFNISSNATNKAPVINGIDTPTTVRVGQNATWTIRASDPENQSLSYYVVWGDENIGSMYASASVPPASAYVQSTTFTHTYNYVGNFTPKFYVKDAQGNVAWVSANVQVTQ